LMTTSISVVSNYSLCANIMLGNEPRMLLPGVVKPLAAFEKGPVRFSLPDARAGEGGGQVDAAGALTGLQHRRNQQPLTQHKLVINPRH